MTLKLYGHPIDLHKAMDFLEGEHLSEPYGAEFHPFKKIPVLVDEESNVKVFESRAIAHYIATKYRDSGPDLSPSEADIKAYASFQQGLSIELSYFDANVGVIAWEAIFHLPYGSLVEQAGFGELLAKYPSVQAWWKRLQKRESWKKVNASE